MKKTLLLLSSILLASTLVLTINQCHNPTPSNPKLSNISNTTDIIIQNSSADDSVQVFVTLQSGESVVGLFGMDSSNINSNSKLWCEYIVGTDTTMVPCKGSFWAKKGIEYHLGRTSEVAGAVISFGADNFGCEAAISHGWQYGINIFEFTINTPSTGNESTDLSCLDGLNSYLKMTVSDNINWIAGGNIFTNPAENKWPLSNNCNIIGVYPYHCDVCCDTLTPPQPECFPFTGCSKTNDINNCQLDRATVRGGYIKCEFLGFTPVIAK